MSVLDLERNYSPWTIKSYRVNLNQFHNWADESGVDEHFALTSPVIRDFVHYLRDELHVCDRSIQQKLATLKSYTGYLRQALPQSDTRNLAVISWHYKATKKLKQSLSEDELDTLLAAVDWRLTELQEQVKNATGEQRRLKKQLCNCVRDRLILILMAGTGLRVGEACSIDLPNIDRENQVIRVLGKGSREREVYYDIARMTAAMDDYLVIREAFSPKSNALFVNSRDGGRLTVRSVELMLKNYLNRADLSQSYTPHSLRHTFASLSIEQGANIKVVSQILGHSNVRTTLSLYTHLSEGNVRKVFRMCHPFTKAKLSDEQIVANRKNSLIYINDATGHWQRQLISSS